MRLDVMDTLEHPSAINALLESSNSFAECINLVEDPDSNSRKPTKCLSLRTVLPCKPSATYREYLCLSDLRLADSIGLEGAPRQMRSAPEAPGAFLANS
jgi:hypothetical protein